MVDYEKFSDGESKFNKSIDDLRRISELQNQANMMSCINSWDGFYQWRNILDALDREICPYLKEEERNLLVEVRVTDLPDGRYHRVLGNVPPLRIRQQLDRWHRQLSLMIAIKGMGLQPKDVRKSFILPDG